MEHERDASRGMSEKHQRLLDEFLSWSDKQTAQISPALILADWDETTSTSRLDRLIRAFHILFDGDHPIVKVVREARKLRRRDMLKRNGPKIDTKSHHWRVVLFPDKCHELTKARIEKVDKFLLWRNSLNQPPTVHQVLHSWEFSETEQPLRLLHKSLVQLMGEDDSLCQTVLEASNIRCSEHRRKRRGQPKKAPATRAQILKKKHWANLLSQPGLRTMPIDRLRLADRFFIFCTERRLADINEHHVQEFLPTQAPSRFWELRNAMEEIFGLRHPIPHVIEAARKLRWQDYASHKGIIGRSSNRPADELKASVPLSELPREWLEIFVRLEEGKSVRGNRLGKATVKGMRQAARELVAAARKAGLADELSIDTVRSLDQNFDERSLQSSSREILCINLWRLARALGEVEVKDALHELRSHYHRKGKYDQTAMEVRHAALPSLAEIFDRANDLKVQGQEERNVKRRSSLLVDAAAIAFLSLIPLRNADTVIRWGEHVTFDEHASDDWCYRIDTRIMKTGAVFGSALHPVLNPFLEAVLLQGRDDLFLSRVRRQAIADRLPVFPTSTGKARGTTGLSGRWQATLGAGSHIARARVHTALGLMGSAGVEAALALCAQRDPRTRKHYQAEALRARQMLQGQDKLRSALPRGLVEERVKLFQDTQKRLGIS